MAPVAQVSYRAVVSGNAQGIGPEVGDCHGFHIGSSVGRYTIAGKRKIARCEYTALRILDIHVGDIGQVADITRHHDIDLVFHRAGLATVSHP